MKGRIKKKKKNNRKQTKVLEYMGEETKGGSNG